MHAPNVNVCHTNTHILTVLCTYIHNIHTHTFTELEVVNLNAEFRTRITAHAVQLLMEKAFREQESYETLTLDPEATGHMVIPVVVGRGS